MPLGFDITRLLRAPRFDDDDDDGIYRDYPPRPRSPGLPPPAPIPINPDMPLPTSRGIPGGVAPPPVRRPTRREQYDEARDVYLQGTPGRGKSALQGAFEGFAGGGGLIGAATGAVYGAADPRGLREQRFNRQVRPRIAEGFQFEDQERALERQAEEDALNAAYKTAQTGALNRSNIPAPPRPRAPIKSDRGLYDPDAGRIIPGTEPPPKAPTPAYRETYTGRTFDISDPAQRAEYERIQSHGPRDRQGRFITRSDERATANANRPKAAKQPPKVVSISKVLEYAQAKGISESDAVAEAMRDGYRIAR